VVDSNILYFHPETLTTEIPADMNEIVEYVQPSNYVDTVDGSEIPNNHLGCIPNPYRYWDKLPTSTGGCRNSSPSTVPWDLGTLIGTNLSSPSLKGKGSNFLPATLYSGGELLGFREYSN